MLVEGNTAKRKPSSIVFDFDEILTVIILLSKEFSLSMTNSRMYCFKLYPFSAVSRVFHHVFTRGLTKAKVSWKTLKDALGLWHDQMVHVGKRVNGGKGI